MKKIYILLTVMSSLLLFAQVGIKTQTPRGQLDVRGKLLIDGYAILENTLDASGNYYLLVRSNDSTPAGEIKKLDVDLRHVAPVNKYIVEVQDVQGTTVLNINTSLDVSKYYLGIGEAYFNTRVRNIGMNNMSPVYGTYKTAVGQNGSGKYTVSLNYSGAQKGTTLQGNWVVSFIVFEKTLVRDWGTVTGSVSATATPNWSGASTGTPLGLQ